MGVNLKDLPAFQSDFNGFPALSHLPGTPSRVRAVGKSLKLALSDPSRVLPGSLVESLKGIMFGKQADFDFITGDIEEDGTGLEDLAKNVRRELVEARTGKMDERERYREERDCNGVGIAHTGGKGRGRGWGRVGKEMSVIRRGEGGRGWRGKEKGRVATCPGARCKPTEISSTKSCRRRASLLWRFNFPRAMSARLAELGLSRRRLPSLAITPFKISGVQSFYLSPSISCSSGPACTASGTYAWYLGRSLERSNMMPFKFSSRLTYSVSGQTQRLGFKKLCPREQTGEPSDLVTVSSNRSLPLAPQ